MMIKSAKAAAVDDRWPTACLTKIMREFKGRMHFKDSSLDQVRRNGPTKLLDKQKAVPWFIPPPPLFLVLSANIKMTIVQFTGNVVLIAQWCRESRLTLKTTVRKTICSERFFLNGTIILHTDSIAFCRKLTGFLSL